MSKLSNLNIRYRKFEFMVFFYSICNKFWD